MTGSTARAARRLATVFLLSAAGPAAAESPAVSAGFALAEARAKLGRPVEAFACPEPVAPWLDMERFQSRYDPKDPTQSRVDPARERAEAERSARLGRFGETLAALSDRAVLARPADPRIGACALGHLAGWARAGALLGATADNDALGRHQAVMTQAWHLATYAAVLVKVGGPDIDPENGPAVRAWIARLARSVMAEYAADGPWLRHGANHYYWAGLAVGFAGAALQDPEMRAFALKALARGLSDVDAAGALPAEIARGPRGAIYQSFATLALVALVRLADANGVALDAAQEAALDRLLAFDAGLVRDPAAIEARTGVRQLPARDRASLAWIDVILPRLRARTPARAAELDALAVAQGARPARHVFLGGNVSLAYDPASWHPER